MTAGKYVRFFARCLDLGDDEITRVLTFIMVEALASGHEAVDMLGRHLNVNMADHWQADKAFFDLLRDKQVIGALLEEVAGPDVAAANISETGKTKKLILQDCLDGSAGRSGPEGWVPRWLQFPARHYLEDRICALANRAARIAEPAAKG